jgi:hypothetical protein
MEEQNWRTPGRLAIFTKLAKDRACILRIRLPRWAFTAISVMPSSPATCLLGNPAETSVKIWRSRLQIPVAVSAFPDEIYGRQALARYRFYEVQKTEIQSQLGRLAITVSDHFKLLVEAGDHLARRQQVRRRPRLR